MSLAIVIIVILVVAAAAGVFYLRYYQPSSSSNTPAGRTLKVALISIGGPSTTWNEATVAGIQNATAQLKNEGINVNYTTNLDVAAADAARVMGDYATAGYQLVIGDSVIYQSALIQTAASFPNTDFLGVAWTGNLTKNLSVYDWNVYEGYYPAGVAAALASKSGTLGYVTAFDFAETAEIYNAFMQGAKTVNPNIKVLYAFTSDWSDPTKGASAAQAMIAQGADVIVGVGDGMTDGVIRQADSSHALAIGYIYDEKSVAPNAVLTSVLWQKTKYFYTAIQAITNGTFGNKEFNFGIKDKTIALAPLLVSSLTSSQMTQVQTAQDDLFNGKLTVQAVATFPPKQ